ncbi:MAG: CAP domain-containing protein [Trebonia sp.]
MNRGPRFLWPGVLALAVLAGGCSVSSSGQGPASTRTAATGCGMAGTSRCAASPADVAVAVPPAVVRVPSSRATSPASPAHQTGATRSSTPSHASSSRATTPAGEVAGPRATGSVASPTPVLSSAPADGTAAGQVLALINKARAAAGRPALTVTSGLEASSSAHNLRMADGCGLSHQCPGEPAIGARETAAGVHWTAAGENIGEGGPVADNATAIAQMAVGLTQSMLNEQPPNDGHRQNILSAAFTHIGIAVYRDNSGTVWLTQDFSN